MSCLLLLLLLPLVTVVASTHHPLACHNDSHIINSILDERYYAKHKLPSERVEVEVEVWVQEITTISDITSDFQLDIYISEMWVDPALRFGHLRPCKHNISLSSEMLEKIWTPRSCFINSKSAFVHSSPYENKFLMLYPNGTVWINYRMQLTGPCQMDLKTFPFDTVKCDLVFESFNYNVDEVSMKWTEVALTKQDDVIELADFLLINTATWRNSVAYPAGNWHELSMQFHFERRYGWYILQAYLPTFLTILISWIAFALGTKAIPARTMLGVNCLLGMTFQFGNIIRNLPRVSYVKAIDVWMLSCMTFVFSSLVELACIGYLGRDLESQGAQLDGVPTTHYTPNYGAAEGGGASHKGGGHEHQHHPVERHKRHARGRGSSMTGKARSMLASVTGKRTDDDGVHKRSPHDDMPRSYNDYGYRPPGVHSNNIYPVSMDGCACLPVGNGGLKQALLPQPTFEPDIHYYGGGGAPRSSIWHRLRHMHKDDLAIRIDQLSSMGFPALFAIFNILYWTLYLSGAMEKFLN